MHPFIRFAAIVWITANVVYSQSPNSNAPTTAAADKAWADLVGLTKPAASSRIRDGRDNNAADRARKIKDQANQSFMASLTARDFYTRYPNHPKAGEARKIEAVAAVRSIQDGNNGQEQMAIAIATGFRNNKSYPAADRFDVALVLERYNQSAAIKNKSVKDEPAEWLKVADKLKAEFGDSAALEAYYLEIARKADTATATKIAADVTRSPVSSTSARAEAQSIIDRAAMIGKPLSVRLPKIRGGEVDLSKQQNKITAVVVWSPNNLDGLAAMKSLSSGLPAGVQIIYLSVGQVSDTLNAQAKLPVAGTICYNPRGAAWKTTSSMMKLQYAPAPCVYVLNRAGNVSGFGTLKDLPLLLSKAAG